MRNRHYHHHIITQYWDQIISKAMCRVAQLVGRRLAVRQARVLNLSSASILEGFSHWAGAYKEMSSILADQWPIASSYMSPNSGGGWSCDVSAGLSQWVQLYTGAQINFGDLTSYLTYDTELPSAEENRENLAEWWLMTDDSVGRMWSNLQPN
jgi:hypothetical protein